MQNHTKRHHILVKFIRIFLVTFLVVGVPSIYFFGGRCSVCHDKGHIIHYYWEQIGIPGVVKYDMVIDMYGEPDDKVYTRMESKNDVYYLIRVEYESLSFLFSGDNEDAPTTWKCYGVTVKDKSIKFNNNIHVGVSKLWVEWMYRHQLKVTEGNNEYWAFGYTEMIEFTYDRYNRVSGITFYG